MSIPNLSRIQKRALMITTDTVLVLLSLWLAFVLRLGVWFQPSQSQLWMFIWGPIVAIPIFTKFGLYREIVRYIGYKGMLAITQATGLMVLLWSLVIITLLPLYFGVEITFPRYLGADLAFPRSIPVLFWMLLLLTIGGSRQAVRWLLSGYPSTILAKRNVLIYGAGRTGLELASSLSHNVDIRILGIIDDDKTLHGHHIQSLKVLGDRSEIVKIRAVTNPLEILLAMPAMKSEQRKELLKYLEDKKVSVKTIPSLNDMASGQAILNDLRDIDINDLLARREVLPNQDLLATCVTGKRTLVTGAGGSIGSELCRQILQLNPTCILLFEHSEHNLYKINIELLSYCAKMNCAVEIIPILGSITNNPRVVEVIKKYKIETIYHAAAYKHVNLIENNIGEGVRNNVFGTYNVANAALNLGVESFILISTDKAVRPSSMMGATKYIAELITQGLSLKGEMDYAGEKQTHFSIVRFGNVLGSSGSVIPLFQQQISSGGPITITHPEATRYFMTISEASQLVIQAGAIGSKCNVFVLNMGNPVSILSLAKQMVYLSGHSLNVDENNTSDSGISIQYTGLQKGEKVHEELFIGNNIKSTEHPMILEAKEDFIEWQKVKDILAELESAYNHSEEKVQQLLMQYAIKMNDDNS